MKNLDEYAFPLMETEWRYGQSGMLLIDYFAAQAMRITITQSRYDTDIAERAYNIAAAMMKRRKEIGLTE